MEKMAQEVSRELGVEIEVYGFDRGRGLPAPRDFRDIPYMWKEGDYRMNFNWLKQKLKRAQLVIGEVKNTVPVFTKKYRPAPIGFVAFDLDFYSSTKEALKIFYAEHQFLLPRIICYFDDVLELDGLGLFNEYIGELAAIREFNDDSRGMKLCKINGLSEGRYFRATWPEATYALHLFNHKLYNQNIANEFIP